MMFCNILFAYFRYVRSLAPAGGRFHGKVNPTWSSGIHTVSVTVNSSESTGALFQFWSIQRVTRKTAH